MLPPALQSCPQERVWKQLHNCSIPAPIPQQNRSGHRVRREGRRVQRTTFFSSSFVRPPVLIDHGCESPDAGVCTFPPVLILARKRSSVNMHDLSSTFFFAFIFFAKSFSRSETFSFLPLARPSHKQMDSGSSPHGTCAHWAHMKL